MPIHLREREVLACILTPDSEGERCTYCKKPIVEGRFYWLGEDGQPRRQDPAWGLGERIMTFPSWRHADGSPGHGDDGHLVLRDANRCPRCKSFDTISIRDTGYGSDCTCTACASVRRRASSTVTVARLARFTATWRRLVVWARAQGWRDPSLPQWFNDGATAEVRAGGAGLDVTS
jgi:hypothetical protein